MNIFVENFVMSESERMFQLISSFYKGYKTNILDIGSYDCSLLHQFLLHNYSNLVALDIRKYNRFECFNKFLEARNQIIPEKVSPLQPEVHNLNPEEVKYIIEYPNYIKAIKPEICDFMKYEVQSKFNIILSSFVFHFYPPENDTEIIDKLVDLSNNNCLIYIKVHNEIRLKTANSEFIRNGSMLKKDNCTWYLFNERRMQTYKNKFKVVYENTINDISEILLLKNPLEKH